MTKLMLRVNGATRVVETDDPDTPLLYVLRNDLGLTGTKFGCGLAQCGACTVLLGGQPIRPCVTPVRTVAGQDATGVRLRTVPFRPDRVKAALDARRA